MAFSIKGYVVEPIRVGANNSPFTTTPSNIISDGSAYNAVYTEAETAPRTEYLTVVQQDGDLPDATFGWTKNETIQRFDYVGTDGQFRPLKGGPLQVVGVITADVNTTRLKIASPTSLADTSAPYRLSVGVTGTGTTLTLISVTSFGSPVSGTVELNTSNGELNWNASDIVTYSGQTVRFQRQAFFTDKESSGRIGLATDDPLVLNPIPGLGVGLNYQKPLVRFGQGLYLTPISSPSESSLASLVVSPGQVGWAITTGKLKFNSSDITAHATKSVFYDGVLFGTNLTLPRQTLGALSSPSSLSTVPAPGGDIIFRVPGVVQFEQSTRVTDFDVTGSQGVVQYKADGSVKFSEADKAKYGPSSSGQVIYCDLPLERGLSVRFFRSPVDLTSTDPTVKDVSSTYTLEDQVMSSPIVGVSQVFLPVVPLEASGYPYSFSVSQGTGSFTGTLPDLSVSSPPSGIGYRIDTESKTLYYSNRVNQKVISLQTPSGFVQLDALVFEPNLLIELETGTNTNTYIAQTANTHYTVEPLSGVVTFTATEGTKVITGSSGACTAGTFTDPNVSFSGVSPGDLLVVYTETNLNSPKGIYTVVTNGGSSLTVTPSFTGSSLSYEIRDNYEVLGDRFFEQKNFPDASTKVERVRQLGTVANSPRLTIRKDLVTKTRFRFGSNNFSTFVTQVATDSNFSTPSGMNPYEVEVSLDTGNLNFSSTAVSGATTLYTVTELTERVDYRIEPARGMVQFTERLLTLDEALITYKNSSGVLLTERATFLVRKELTQDHPAPTSILTFNPSGKELATNPEPQVFRGGRPQVKGTNYNLSGSTLTFLADRQVTDAIPHGPTIAPSENVYVDYYVYQAFGGENTLTVLQSPMLYSKPTIADFGSGTLTLRVSGDQTSSVSSSYLLMVEGEQVYKISSVTYLSSEGVTEIALANPQEFKEAITGPKLHLSSGPISNGYFIAELSPYETIPRGSNKIRVQGDVTNNYRTGTIVYLSLGSSVADYYYVTGAEYKTDAATTEVTLSTSTSKQYTYGTHSLRKSVRPIFNSAPTEVQTLRVPVLTQPYAVFRRVGGGVGQLVSSPVDYSIDDAGKVKFKTPLAPQEEFGAFYTGYKLQPASGPRVRVSYTHDISPNESNGLANQTLLADFSIYSPDSFFFRVETMGNFKGELEKKFKEEAKSSVPSGGPQTSNSGGSQNLYEKGSESLFFTEQHLLNEDIVAKKTLKFYNDEVNLLEDCLASMDGRIVGDQDGRFKFNGLVSNVSSFSSATNQIDDLVKISDFPYSFPPLVSIGTRVSAYTQGPLSRFYPTKRNRFGVVVKGKSTGAKTGEAILDIGTKNITGVANLRRRTPRALVASDTQPGSTSLSFTDAKGTTDVFPLFVDDMKVIVTDRDGTPLITNGSPLTVASVSTGTLTFTTGCPVLIPKGATIYMAPSDTTYQKILQVGKDLNVDSDAGTLLYVEPYAPLDGSVPGLEDIQIQAPEQYDSLQMDITFQSTSTEPEKIPALFGGTTDDDGDTAIPIYQYRCELGEISKITSTISPISGQVTPSFLGQGNLDVTKTIITNAPSGVVTVWPSPVPKLYDLVRIKSGLNGSTSFRQIVSVGANTITVGSAFALQDTQFSFEVTTNTSLVASSTTSGTTTTKIVDNTVDFVTLGVLPGHTVVIPGLSGARRSITSVSATQLTLSSAVTGLVSGTAYRVDNPLATFGGVEKIAGSTGGLLAVLLTNDHDVNPLVFTCEKLALERFLDGTFEDLQSPSSQTATVSGSVLTSSTNLAGLIDTNNDTLPDEPCYVYIRTGSNRGIYPVQSVAGLTVTVGGSFVSPGSVQYRLVKAFGVGKEALISLMGTLGRVDDFIASVQAFQALVAPVPVLVSGVVDPTIYANGITLADLTSWSTTVSNRTPALTDPTGDIKVIEGILASSDKLYEKRYTWIDARINLEKGILIKANRAIQQRLKAQADILKQLIKLLAVGA